jgi:LuxR family maltose regulon positive regulatory protein
LDDKTKNLIGLIAAARATLALTRYKVDEMLAQARRALAYLGPDSPISRASANWTLGYAYLLKKDYAAARRALTEAISIGQAAGDRFTTILATIGLGNVQEADNQLYQAAETYRRVLQLAGDQPLQIICEAHLGLARVLYEWNELEAAEQHGRQSLELAQQYGPAIDRFVSSEVFLARLKLACGDVAGATAMLVQTDRSVRHHNFVQRMPEVVAAQVLALLGQGQLAEAAHLAETHPLPLSQARVHLAKRDASAALEALEPWRRQAKDKGWQRDLLEASILQAVTLRALGKKGEAVGLLADALALAEPGGYIRVFVDEGPPMASLLSEAAAQGLVVDYAGKLLAVLEAEERRSKGAPDRPATQPLIEPLSQRELEVLELIAQGLSNREIGERLYLALDTVKGHNRRIYRKLEVHRRTEAVARARELGLL